MGSAGRDSVLELEGIAKSHDDRVVLDGVDLIVPMGAIVGIRGESGAGKTTLARIMAGIDLRFSGYRRCVDGGAHLVFQDSLQALNPRIGLGWTLAEACSDGTMPGILAARRQHRAEIVAALTEVGLPDDLLHLRPGQLSGGQRQRVAIARALLSGARLLVLDEPVAALDPSVQARILNLLVRLHARRELAIVVISHDHAVLDFLCEAQYELQGGRLWRT